MRALRWVVFDYGQVICERTTALPDLVAALDRDPDADLPAFEQGYWAARDAYDRGMPDLEYWSAAAASLGVTVDEPMAAELTRIDTAGWLRLSENSLELLRVLREGGVPLALLSNATSSFGRELERQPWTACFEHMVFSGDLGIAKPDRKIWMVLLERLGASAGDCLFLDDRQDNVDGARMAGLDPLLWTGASAARDWLTARGVLGSP